MMGLFEHWPYVNFHDMNLDWIIKKIKNIETSEANSQASAEAAAESAAASQLSADASQASADASQLSAEASELSAGSSQSYAQESLQHANDAAETVSNTLNQINLLQSRVDNIIPEGTQTEGNTELIDIRVSADGTIYDSAGNAVRGQISDLKRAINDLYATIIDYGTLIDDKYIDTYSGDEATAADSVCSNYIEVDSDYSIAFYNISTRGTRSVWCYGSDQNPLSRISPSTEVTTFTAQLPSNAKYIRFTALKGQKPQLIYKNKLTKDLDDIKVDSAFAIDNLAISKAGVPYLGLRQYKAPNDFGASMPVDVYTDGNRYIADFDSDAFMHHGGTTYYVSTANAYANNGLTPETATSFVHAYTLANNGDSIVFLPGIYSRENMTWNAEIQKSINIIGDSGGVVIIDGNRPAFSKVEGYTNVYMATRSSAWRVLDVYFGMNRIVTYTKKNSIADVDNTTGSYYISGSSVYVNPLHTTDSLWVCVDSEKEFDANNATQNLNLYVRNFTIIGKKTGIKLIKDTESYTMFVCLDHVTALFCGDDSTDKDSFLVYGANCVFNECKAICSAKDGFNYSGVLRDTSIRTNHTVMEINCLSAGDGIGTPYNTMNATTAHNGSKVIRVNGKYYDTQGAPIADVGEGTKSVNLGCNVFVPRKIVSGAEEWTQGISAQQAGAEMWCENCLAVGSTGGDFYCVTGATMHLFRCGYINKAGNGTIEEIDTINPIAVLLANQNNLFWR